MEIGQNNFVALQEATEKIREEIGKIIVGQQEMIEQIILALLANGHILIEGVPGVAKTLAAKLTSSAIDVGFSRIQFTPDLMPADVIGSSIFNVKNQEFEFKKGPIFSNFVLCDEINRAPAKTQAALFESMQEKQVTVDGKTYKLDEPFLVLATQNPIEQEGTYRLPEAQLDRFLFKIMVDYPNLDEEIEILNQTQQSSISLQDRRVEKVLTKEALIEFRKACKDVKVEEKLIEFIAKIVQKTRNNASIYLGASPRASIAILETSKVKAAISGRDFVIPEDILYVANPVLRHRIQATPEKEMEGISIDRIIKDLIDSIEIPR